MLKTSDRDKNTPHSVGFILSTLDYTLRQVRRWNKFRTNHYSKQNGQVKRKCHTDISVINCDISQYWRTLIPIMETTLNILQKLRCVEWFVIT
jgi:hypothetical protein